MCREGEAARRGSGRGLGRGCGMEGAGLEGWSGRGRGRASSGGEQGEGLRVLLMWLACALVARAVHLDHPSGGRGESGSAR